MYLYLCSDISGGSLGSGRATAGSDDFWVSGTFITAVLITSGVLPAILQHSDKEPNEATCTVTVKQRLWNHDVMCVSECVCLGVTCGYQRPCTLFLSIVSILCCGQVRQELHLQPLLFVSPVTPAVNRCQSTSVLNDDHICYQLLISLHPHTGIIQWEQRWACARFTSRFPCNVLFPGRFLIDSNKPSKGPEVLSSYQVKLPNINILGFQYYSPATEKPGRQMREGGEHWCLSSLVLWRDCRSKKKKKVCCKALSYRNNTVVRGALNIKASLSTKPNQQNKCCWCTLLQSTDMLQLFVSLSSIVQFHVVTALCSCSG